MEGDVEGASRSPPLRSSARRSSSRRSRRMIVEETVDPTVIAQLHPDLVPFMHRCTERQMDMEDPVVARDGHTYERAAIEAHIRKHGKSPISGVALELDGLFENRAVSMQIDTMIEAEEETDAANSAAAGVGPLARQTSATLVQMLAEPDELAAGGDLETASRLYAALIRDLTAQMSALPADGGFSRRSSGGSPRADLAEKIVILKQRLAGVQAPPIEASAVGGEHPFSPSVGAPAQSTNLSSSMRCETEDYENGQPPELPAGCSTSGPEGLLELLTECAQYNSESQGDDEPVKGKSMWLRYNAGKRRGLWREVWPCTDNPESPAWLRVSSNPSFQPYFRGLEADHLDTVHGRTTKYLLHLVEEISAEWNDRMQQQQQQQQRLLQLQPTSSSMSTVTDDGSDWAGLSSRPALVGDSLRESGGFSLGQQQQEEGGLPSVTVRCSTEGSAASPATMHLLQEAAAAAAEPEEQEEQEEEREPEPEQTPMAAAAAPAAPPASPVLPPLALGASARDIFKHCDVPSHVADLLEEEDIHTAETLMDLDAGMLEKLDLKLGEHIKVKQVMRALKM